MPSKKIKLDLMPPVWWKKWLQNHLPMDLPVSKLIPVTLPPHMTQLEKSGQLVIQPVSIW